MLFGDASGRPMEVGRTPSISSAWARPPASSHIATITHTANKPRAGKPPALKFRARIVFTLIFVVIVGVLFSSTLLGDGQTCWRANKLTTMRMCTPFSTTSRGAPYLRIFVTGCHPEVSRRWRTLAPSGVIENGFRNTQARNPTITLHT